ncbi:MAG: BrnT family toxin [Elusimicrobiota bacterium]
MGKNRKLARERGITFEAVVAYIEAGAIAAVVPGRGRFGHQKQFLVIANSYIYIVPFVEEEGRIFLKTIIPSRKMTKRYLSGGL